MESRVLGIQADRITVILDGPCIVSFAIAEIATTVIDLGVFRGSRDGSVVVSECLARHSSLLPKERPVVVWGGETRGEADRFAEIRKGFVPLPLLRPETSAAIEKSMIGMNHRCK